MVSNPSPWLGFNALRLGENVPMTDRTANLLKSWLWALVPLLTLGFGTAAIMAHAAVKRKSLLQGAAMPVYLAGLAIVLAVDPDHGSRQEFIHGVGMTVNMGLGFVHAVAIRSWVFPRPGDPDRLETRQRTAIQARRAAAEARKKARALMADDPALARDLGIGRPDLPGREYPDGGLIDVNTVDADTLVTHGRFPRDWAAKIVARRAEVGGFDSVEDLALMTDAHPQVMDPIREYLVFSR